MQIKDVLYEAPEMTEEKLLKIIETNYKYFLRSNTLKRLSETYKVYNNDEISQAILKEWDLIQDKKSYLTKSQRDEICILVSKCLIYMTKK